MKRAFTFGLLAAICAHVAQAAPQYDKTRFDQIQAAINTSTNHLLGKSLDEVSNLLSLKDVSWDTGYSNYPLGEQRIYHFRGFYLSVHLEILPKGITPLDNKGFSFTEQDLRKNGVRWLAAFYPFVQIDGLTNPAVRMTNYWVAVNSAFRKRDEMKQTGTTAP